MAIAHKHHPLVIEDAAQGIMSTHRSRPLGSIGHLGTPSFHETKNVVSGEAGALLVNDTRFAERAQIIREKGTNRSQFFRGQVSNISGSISGRHCCLPRSSRRTCGLNWKRQIS